MEDTESLQLKAQLSIMKEFLEFVEAETNVDKIYEKVENKINEESME
jgi:hypothetical protein